MFQLSVRTLHNAYYSARLLQINIYTIVPVINVSGGTLQQDTLANASMCYAVYDAVIKTVEKE